MHILIIDDHPAFRVGIAGILSRLEGHVQISECENCEEGMELLATGIDCALILLDLSLSGIDGMTGISLLRKITPSTPIIILSASNDKSDVKMAIDRGAKGFIPKSVDSDVILGAIGLVLSGGVYLPSSILLNRTGAQAGSDGAGEADPLTQRQREVLILLAQGNSNKEIGDKLDMAENTVRVHVASILKILSVKNRTEAGYKAARLGLISP